MVKPLGIDESAVQKHLEVLKQNAYLPTLTSPTCLFILQMQFENPRDCGIGLWPVRASATGLINLLVDAIG